MKNIHLSLKSKIFISIIFLLITTICFNLFYSINLFSSDKEAYVFENALKRASTLDNQLLTDLTNFKKMSQMISLVDETKLASFKKNISENNSFDFSFNIALNGDQLDYQNFSIYNDRSSLFLNKSPEELKEIFKVFIIKKLIKPSEISLLELSDKYFFAYAIKNEATNNLFVTVLEATKSLSLLYSDQIFKNTLIWKVDNNNYITIPAKQSSQNIIKILNATDMTRGAQNQEIDSNKYILGFSKNKDLGFSIVTTIPHSSAFQVTQFLILKTIIWAISLAGFAIIFGVLLTGSIVKPIKSLTEAAKKIANGDLDIDIQLKTDDEFKTLANAFLFMVSKIKTLLQAKQLMIEELKITSLKLADLNKTLEIKVKERTKELNTSNLFLKAMVNSLNQGLVVLNRELKCNKIHTEATKTILGKDPNDVFFYELLDLKPEDRESLKEWATIIFDELLSFESAALLAPASKIWGENVHDINYKFVNLEYFPMRNSIGKIENIVAVSTDQTVEIRATEQFRESQSRVAMFLKILNNKKQFSSFIKEVEHIFLNIEKSLQEKTEQSCKTLMLLFHTLNGGFGLYHLLELQSLSRGCEVEIAKISHTDSNQISESYSILYNEFQDLINLFYKSIVEVETSLGFKFTQDINILEISNNDLLRIQHRIKLTQDKELNHLFEEFFIKEPILDYLKGYKDFVAKESLKIGKEIEAVEINDNNIKINIKPFQEFFSTLIHVFRNSLDHGIETPEQRTTLGKSAKGKIIIETKMQDNWLQLKISDDGGGINLEKIKTKLKSLKIDSQNLSDMALINYIFEPFFSTKDEVTALSGRGVGMSSVKEAMNKLGGTIEIITQKNMGTSFIFMLPLLNT
jgi:two-component system chemotaxis sensor kinase CheA